MTTSLWFVFRCAWDKGGVRLRAKVRPGMTAGAIAEELVARACDWFAVDPRFLRVEAPCDADA